MLKKKETKIEKIKTVFDLPIKESKTSFKEIAKCVYSIIENPKFAEIASKIPVPAGATQKDIENMIKEYTPKKIQNVLDLLLEDNYSDIIKICALVFCETVDFYETKSLNQIAEDFSRLTKDEAYQILGFFTRAGK